MVYRCAAGDRLPWLPVDNRKSASGSMDMTADRMFALGEAHFHEITPGQLCQQGKGEFEELGPREALVGVVQEQVGQRLRGARHGSPGCSGASRG